MSGLIIHAGNRLELLVRQLAEDIRPPQSSVLAPEIIITQSHGMARWVAMELALDQRISANLMFPFPNAFLNLLGDKLSLDAPGPDDPFSQDNMTFQIMKKLPACLAKPGYESLRNYFMDDGRQLKRLQLSQRIAHLFDQYLVFRPDMIRTWDRGGRPGDSDQAWQADLWRDIASGNEHLHRVSLQKRLMDSLMSKTAEPDALPARISVFGISYLPAFHLQVLTTLSQRIPVNWYFLSPCREYWGTVVSGRSISRIRDRYEHGAIAQADLHLDTGNSLLASMGAMGRDFLNMISDAGSDLHEHYVKPGRNTLLGNIQADILDMVDAADPPNMPAGSAHRRRFNASADDHSVELHACHSAMRETEVLHDNLLDMFQRMPDLKPRDVLVMAPDIDTYAPFIQAVFDNRAAHQARIPFSLADRSAFYQNPVTEPFLTFLDIARSRMEADKVAGLLEFPAIRRQFDLDEQDVAVIGKWVRDLNIRWGLDSADRKNRGLPVFPENTWKSGLDRLLLGYAMPGNGYGMFAGLPPYDDVEGELGSVLGNFMDFFSCVQKSLQSLAAPKTLQAWSTDLQAIVDGLLSTDHAWDKERRALQQLLGQLARVQQATEYDEKIALEAVVHYLKRELEGTTFGAGFLSGNVTFCAMLPMRSIPFNVICLLGMDGNAFPRKDRALGFDVMATHPQQGDRSARDDDKYLFLEALLSARRKLYISYVGRDIQDNAPIAPSVLVSELLDYAANGYGVSEQHLVRQHPLQAFSADYFIGNPALFSYSDENFVAAVAAQQAPTMPEKAIAAPLSEPTENFRQLDIDTLGVFFASPLKFFLQTRLGIYLTGDGSLPESRENFRISGLEGFKAGQEFLLAGSRSNRTDELMGFFSAKGVLPPGRVGAHDFAEISSAAGDLAARKHNRTSGMKPRSMAIDLQLGDFTIKGILPDIYGQTAVLARFARFNPRDLMRCWVVHLLLCAEGSTQGEASQSVYLSRDASGVFTPPDNCREILAGLLRHYWQGLSAPLPFYPRASHAYAHARLQQSKSRAAALQAAAGILQGSPHNPGEIEEPYLDFYFDETANLGATFEQTALEIFEPLFESYTATPFKPSLTVKDIKAL